MQLLHVCWLQSGARYFAWTLLQTTATATGKEQEQRIQNIYKIENKKENKNKTDKRCDNNNNNKKIIESCTNEWKVNGKQNRNWFSRARNIEHKKGSKTAHKNHAKQTRAQIHSPNVRIFGNIGFRFSFLRIRIYQKA